MNENHAKNMSFTNPKGKREVKKFCFSETFDQLFIFFNAIKLFNLILSYKNHFFGKQNFKICSRQKYKKIS